MILCDGSVLLLDVTVVCYVYHCLQVTLARDLDHISLSPLQYFLDLEVLHVYSCATEVSHAGDLRHLQFLSEMVLDFNLNRVGTTSIFVDLPPYCMPYLTDLHLSGCGPVDLATFAPSLQLTDLSLQHCTVHRAVDLPTNAALRNLQSLTMKSVRVAGRCLERMRWADLIELRELQMTDLEPALQFELHDWSWLLPLAPKLLVLSLAGTDGVGLPPLARFPRLFSLDTSNNQHPWLLGTIVGAPEVAVPLPLPDAGDAVPATVAIGPTVPTGTIAAMIPQPLPTRKLPRLSQLRADISIQEEPHLCRLLQTCCERLRVLDLSVWREPGPGSLTALSCLSRLETCRLWVLPNTAGVPVLLLRAISRCTQIRHLFLEHFDFDHRVARHLRDLSVLETLHLGTRNKCLTDKAIKMIVSHHPQLSKLLLGECPQLTATFPRLLSPLTKLCLLAVTVLPRSPARNNRSNHKSPGRPEASSSLRNPPKGITWEAFRSLPSRPSDCPVLVIDPLKGWKSTLRHNAILEMLERDDPLLYKGTCSPL